MATGPVRGVQVMVPRWKAPATSPATGYPRSPFFDYFRQVAESSYQGKTIEPKVKKAQQEHKVLFQFCVIANMTLRVFVVILTLVFIVAVALKTLWPVIDSGG